MRAKFLKIVFLMTFFLMYSTAAFARPSLGQCFDSTEIFRQKYFDHLEFGGDPNITENTQGRGVWIVDQTPGVNFDRSLFERMDGKFCYRAQLTASSVDLHKSAGKWVIDVVIPQIGLTSGKAGHYELNSGEKYFVLTKCSSININGKHKSFSCRAWND